MTRENDLHKELWSEFETEARQIKARARQKGQRFLEDNLHTLREREQQAREDVERDLNLQRSRSLSRAQLEGRNTLLRTKQEAVDKVIEGAREELRKMSSENPERYCELLMTFFSAGRKLLPGESVRVRIGPDAETCKKRLEEQKKTQVDVDPDLSGIVLESPEGRLRCDFTWDHLLQRLRRDREADIAALLFGEDHE